MNKTKKYMSLIVEILLIFSIILSVSAIFVKTIVLNKNTYVNLFNKNGIYEQVKESVYEKMDKELGSKSFDNDMKESIISEEDIRKEADNVITGVIQYLETGDNSNIPTIDTQVYKLRVHDILNEILGNVVKESKNELSFDSTMEPNNISWIDTELKFENMVSNEQKVQVNNMVVLKESPQNEQDYIATEKLMTPSEARSKLQSILKEKGLTEAEARQKMVEKGITEDQALQILEGYGISIDEAESSGDGTSNNSQDEASGTNNSSELNNNQEQASGIPGQVSENINGTDDGSEKNNGRSFVSKIQKEVINAIMTNDGSSIEEKINSIENKILDEAGTSIDNEIQKMNLNKLMESSKFEKLAKIISIFSKMFWLFMILPIIFSLMLIKLNNKKLHASLTYIGSGFLIAGLFILTIFFGGYISRFYENININTVYFKDIISVTAKHLLNALSISGIITFGIGVILLIPVIKNTLLNRLRK